jgi:hypothetical protein
MAWGSATALDVLDRVNRLLGIVDISDKAARILGHVVNDGGIADSIIASGFAGAPAANAVIASVVTPGAGVYRLTITAAQEKAPGAGPDAPNIAIKHGATILSGSLELGMSGIPAHHIIPRLTIAGGENIDAIARGAAGAGNTYHLTMVATRIS